MAVTDITALGTTILHSLWQATLLAGVLWLISRRAGLAARFRYGIAYTVLLVQCVLSVATFLHYRVPNPRIEATVKQAVVDFVALRPAPALTAGTIYTPEFWMAALVSCWLLGMALGSIKLSVSLWRVKAIRRSATSGLPSQLESQVRYLAGRIGYFGPLCLRCSEAVSAPMLVGHLKPMLLFPVALVNQLSTEESETVILHELAHLRRYDHWFNLLQCLIEVVFYYHPAVHWIGARIREEREHCCDDLVLRYGPGRLPYARALLYFSEATATSPAALSLTDGGGLLARVRRFINQQELSYNMKSRILLLPLLAVTVLVATAAYVPSLSPGEDLTVDREAPAPAPGAQHLPSAVDTLPRGTHQVTRISDGKTTRLRVEDGEIKELELEGKRIPEAEFPAYEDRAEELLGIDRPRDGIHSGRAIVMEGEAFPFPDSARLFRSLSALENQNFDFDFDFPMEDVRKSLERAQISMDSLQGQLKSLRFDALDGNIFLDSDLKALDSVYTRSFDGLRMYRHRLENIEDIDDLEELEAKERVLEEALEQLEERKQQLRQRGDTRGEAMLETVRARREQAMAMARQQRETLRQRRHLPPSPAECPQTAMLDGTGSARVQVYSRLPVRSVAGVSTRTYGSAKAYRVETNGEEPVILYELNAAGTMPE